MQETKLRSFLKTISWRVFATLTTIVIAYIITGSIVASATIGGTELIAKLFLYYAHERMWDKIKIGKAN